MSNYTTAEESNEQQTIEEPPPSDPIPIRKYLSSLRQETFSDTDKTGKIILHKSLVNQDVIILDSNVGEGAQGKVYRARIGKHRVCVKYSFRAEREDTKFLEKLWKLVIDFSCAHFSHENVVMYLGFYTGNDCQTGLVMEELECNLATLIKHNVGTESERLRIALDIACGIQFLHRLGIIHFDVKAENVLITKEGRAKLADFGASFCSNYRENFQMEYRAINMKVAPPQDDGEKKVDARKQRDSYAFGLLLYHLISGKRLEPNLDPSTLEEKKGLDVPSTPKYERLARLVKQCLNLCPPRPNFDIIVSELLALQDSHLDCIQITENLKILPESNRTPAHYYCLLGQTELLRKYLTENPSALSVRDKFGFLPLHYAASAGFTDTVAYCIKKYPQAINDQNNDRNSPPLVLAIQRIHYHTVQYLLQSGANVNCKAETIDLTPLHCAATGGLEMIVLLLNWKANLNSELTLMEQLPIPIVQIFKEKWTTNTSPISLAKYHLDCVPPEIYQFFLSVQGLQQMPIQPVSTQRINSNMLSQILNNVTHSLPQHNNTSNVTVQNRTQINQLIEMGFSEHQAIEALERNGWDINLAINYLFEQQNIY